MVTDCDVDAADLHLLLEPQILESESYSGGRVMSIDPGLCRVCGRCIDICQWSAITQENNLVSVDPDKCEGCGACRLVCLEKAITAHETHDGKWYWSSTRCGYMSHATLEPGKENSGKLVTRLRKNTALRKREKSDRTPPVRESKKGIWPDRFTMFSLCRNSNFSDTLSFKGSTGCYNFLSPLPRAS